MCLCLHVCTALPGKAVLEMIYTVLGGTLNSTHSLLSSVHTCQESHGRFRAELGGGLALMISGGRVG